MPRFGLCASPTIATAAKGAGWDYLEAAVQTLLQGDTPDDAWTGKSLIEGLALPIEAANLLLPGDLPIVGATIDQPRIDTYLARIFKRAAKCGIQTIVFGAGGPRKVPEDFDRETAKNQIQFFLTHAARYAATSNITLVIEPLNSGECNILNTVREAAMYVTAINHPNIRCLVDSYHFWLEKEPLSNLAEAMKYITHVHVADEHGREPPGHAAIASDYRAFFRTLKAGGYDGRISVESWRLTEERLAETLEFLKREWVAA